MGSSETRLHMGLNVLLLRHSGLNGDFGDTSVWGIRGERLRLSGSNGDFGDKSTQGPNRGTSQSQCFKWGLLSHVCVSDTVV